MMKEHNYIDSCRSLQYANMDLNLDLVRKEKNPLFLVGHKLSIEIGM